MVEMAAQQRECVLIPLEPGHLKMVDGKFYVRRILTQLTKRQDFPGGAVVKNPPANAGDTGSIPDPGRSHVPWSN